jgi:nucleoside phosphorylase
MIVILTALDLECAAMRAHLGDLKPHHHSAGTVFEVGHLAARPECTVALAVIGMGTANAAAITERAITEFQPSAVVFVGVAGALREWIALGDIVVATRVYAYQGGRIDGDEFLVRPRAWDTSHRLVQLAKHVNRSKAWPTPTGSSVSVHFEPIAAGDVVLNSKTASEAQHLRSHYNDAVAVEMESAGMALAGHLAESTPTIAVRGVCDLADGAKADADRGGWQFLAAHNAAAFAVGLAAAIVESTEPTTSPTGIQAATLPAHTMQPSQPRPTRPSVEQTNSTQPATGQTTVTAGRDQKIRGNVVIGDGSVTVDQRRNYRMGLGALAAIALGAAATLVVGLTIDGQYTIGGAAVPNTDISSASSAAKPLATIAPTSLGPQVARLEASKDRYTYDDTTLYSITSGQRQQGIMLTATTISSGRQRWSSTFPYTVVPTGVNPGLIDAGTPVVVTINGSNLVAAPYTGIKPGKGTTPNEIYTGVLAVDSSTGHIKWSSENGQPPTDPGSSGRGLVLVGRDATLALSWITKIGNFVDSHSNTYTTVALSATDGSPLWMNTDFHPVAIDGTAILGFDSDNRPLGMAASDGHRLWAFDERLYSLHMSQVSPGTIFVTGRDSTDYATLISLLVDAANGSKIVEFRDKQIGYDHAADGGQGVTILYTRYTVTAYDTPSSQQLWTLPEPTANRVAPLITMAWRGVAYGIGTDDKVVMLDARTGKEIASTLPCPPTILVPGYALCGTFVDFTTEGFTVYPIK